MIYYKHISPSSVQISVLPSACPHIFYSHSQDLMYRNQIYITTYHTEGIYLRVYIPWSKAHVPQQSKAPWGSPREDFPRQDPMGTIMMFVV